METSNSVDHQVLQPSTSANFTATHVQPSQPVSSALPERVSSKQEQRPSLETQTGISTSAPNTEPSVPNERIQDGILLSPETDSGNLEDYLKTRPNSDHEGWELFYSYKTLEDRPGTYLFRDLVHLDWVNVIDEYRDRPATTFANLLPVLERALLQPSS